MKLRTTAALLSIFLLGSSLCSLTLAEDGKVFPYGLVPREKPDLPLSAAMNRVYESTYGGRECASNEFFTRFKYTPLKGLDYHGHDGTVSRRDATKVIRANGKYYVW